MDDRPKIRELEYVDLCGRPVLTDSRIYDPLTDEAVEHAMGHMNWTREEAVEYARASIERIRAAGGKETIQGNDGETRWELTLVEKPGDDPVIGMHVPPNSSN